MIAWEYCCHEMQSHDSVEIEAALLLLGNKGWEAVCMIPNGPYLLLKRPQSSDGNSEVVDSTFGNDPF